MKSSGVAFEGLDHFAVGNDFGDKAGGPQQRFGRQADERITPEAFTTHHRFEQEAVACAAGQFEVQRQRRLQVGKGLGDQRDAVIALRSKALEFKFSDHLQHQFTQGLGMRQGGLGGRVVRGARQPSGSQTCGGRARQGQTPWPCVQQGPATGAQGGEGWCGITRRSLVQCSLRAAVAAQWALHRPI